MSIKQGSRVIAGGGSSSTSLRTLTDVNILNPISGEVLKYDGTKWVNDTTQTNIEWGDITGDLSDQSDLNSALSSKQPTLISGSNIKTINNQSVIGSGNLEIKGSEEDNLTIVKNAQNKIQAEGTLNKNVVTGATSVLYDWIGTKAEWTAQNIATLHPDWVWYITDDVGSGDDIYTKEEVDRLLNDKQNKLISGINIKSINSVSLLDSGNIDVQSTITGGASTITSNNLTASRALVSNSNGKVSVSDITSTELDYLDGVTSNVQTQLNSKVDKITSASKVYATNASGGQTSLSYDAFATGNTVAVRGNDGTVDVSTPYANNHAANKSYVDTAVASKSTVSVSATGTAIDEVKYITVDGVQKKIGGTNVIALTKAEYDALVTKDPAITYIITDDLQGNPLVLAQILEALNAKQDILGNNVDYVIDRREPTAENNYTWYRKYKSGWVEQGGKYQSTGNAYQTYNLIVTMADSNYTLVCSYQDVAGSDSSVRGLNTGSYTTTTFMAKNGVSGSNVLFNWQVSGIAAQGELNESILR